MSLSRREFLKLGAVATAATAAVSCSEAARLVAQGQQAESLSVPTPPADGGAMAAGWPADPLLRLLNRGGYGPRPGDVERARTLGLEAYLEEQLHPEGMEDTAAELLVRGLSHYNMDVDALLALENGRDAARELAIATVGRALLSRRQLYEVMVEFWSDHFNIYLRKQGNMVYLKIVDDRDVIRPHALGSFRDLLFASARSPAMLVYLDNVANAKGRPNENYARELLELHTMGVDGGYSQRDVEAVARALTGWGVQRRGLGRGRFRFNVEAHDMGAKEVLGHTLPGGRGEEDVHDVLEILAAHPATARFIATKLVRRFVADEPPAALVDAVAITFQESDGDVKAMLRTLFLSDAFATAPPKLKRPYTFLISVLRALDGDVRLTAVGRGGVTQLGRWLQRLGQPPFLWAAPDGYPDVSSAWAANLLPRWNFCLALLHERIAGVQLPLQELAAAGGASSTKEALDLFAGLLLQRPMTAEARALFEAYAGGGDGERPERRRLRDAIALMAAGPAFQWT